MKDFSVGPAGLFAPQRQRRLLESLLTRVETCQQQRQELIQRHAAEREEEEKHLLHSRSGVTEDCRRQRRVTLGQWDAAEETIFSGYEEESIRLRTELNRLASQYRKKLAEGKLTLENKVEARCAAISHQYESNKGRPGQQSKKEIEKINASLKDIAQDVALARDLTIRRLDRLPNVAEPSSAEEDVQVGKPESIEQSIRIIQDLTGRCREHLSELQTGAAARFVDSFYLPAGVAVAVVIWCLAVIAIRPSAFWIYLIAGVAAAGVLGFAIYASLLIPLRRQTRRLYPMIERTGRAAEETATAGRKISADSARAAAADLLSHRDRQLESADSWHEEQIERLTEQLAREEQAAKAEMTDQLSHLDDDFSTRYAEMNGEMHHRAEQVAATITENLADTDQSLQQQRETGAKRRHEELRRVTDRLRIGVNAGLQRIRSLGDRESDRFPDWAEIAARPQTDQDNLDFVPLGRLSVSQTLTPALTSSGGGAPQNQSKNGFEATPFFKAQEIPNGIPLALHRRLHSGLIIHAAKNQMQAAIDVAHQALWRMLTGTSGGRTRLTLIDPIGRGQNFTSFMSLADHDPGLVSHRVWTTEPQIESRLGEIAQHAEDVLQASLRDRFERVEDYNQLAGSMAEPYQAVAAVGFPEGLTRGGYKHLRALIESGVRCGVFVLMVCDQDQAWPGDLPLPRDSRLLELSVDAAGDWKLKHDGLEHLSFQPAENVPVDLRSDLVDKIGTAATMAARVEIPLPSILPAAISGQGCTDDGIDITVGSQGGQRSLALRLGEGVRQHVLIAGKTGSGKSTLLHSIITSGAYHYTPDQLQFYLLDFKKGVEFKSYADSELPHARVIGIESEREFGRSVLQRLDDELQQRGELFRSQSTQELCDYRAASGQPMPRIMLVIDEFQELFVRDDRVAADCAMLLDRLVRQGRSFGIHVILSSQSLAGAYSLPRATLGQMAVRIAMQCSESDAALILSDDNTAARLITRPGEAIYNDAGGLIEGNQPFQVAWLSNEDHDSLLTEIATRDQEYNDRYPPPVIFQGNRPCKWTPALASAAIDRDGPAGDTVQGLLGESVEIGPPVALQLSRNAGRNVVVIPPAEARPGLLSAILAGFAKSHSDLEVIYFNGNRQNESPSLYPWLMRSGINVTEVKPRESTTEMSRLVELVKERGDEAENVHPIVIVIDPLDRFRDFRHEDAFSFSLDASPNSMTGGQALREVLKDGPPAHVYSILVCGGAEIVSRWLPRQSQHDVELRILGRLNASDSSQLIDSPIASELSTATMLMYDEPAGRIQKFRQPDQPDASVVKEWLER